MIDMNCKVACAIAFLSGAAIGAVTTWKIVKTKYEQMVENESAEIREFYRKKSQERTQLDDESEPEKSDGNLDEYNKLVDYYINEKKGEPMATDKPYVISPDEFAENYDYEAISLTYYADGVLTDFADKVIDNVEELVGKDSLTHFGEYEDDSVFVRNDKKKTDYEILRDYRNFSEVKESLSLNGE